MDKKDLLSQQLDHVSSDALNTPSKAQEQIQEASQQAHVSNKKGSTQSLHGEDLPSSDVYRTTNKQ
ncbi:hypothetical protein AB1I92_08940 [Bacillus mobilis]|uniref:DUF4025 domain-containing protein n=2 Tax=Bacillus cereus group TaxID=86661 RepID=A0A1C4CJZ4_BACCE|nr:MULTISPECIES: hypothetical protein [Bacillus cereus group]MCU5595705.1 hypothetical protein [Bacillus mobilis]MCU5739478.1 hypothetical protein [Bacillus mobilis]MCU9562362.1 hypothetical protein [Bacillus mobilis]OKA37542.1 hypothetical protein BJR06_08710 [Bacillus cereus]OKA40394.1 hypothetical protein BJR07_00330 [Bacillus cereus]